MIRELYSTQYNSNDHTDENAIAQLMLNEPDKLARRLTYLWGEESNKFSFLSMTESQIGGYDEVVNDVQYTWDVIGKFKHTAKVVGDPDSTITSKGLAWGEFRLDFDSNWLIPDYTIMAPDGTTKCHIHGEPEKISAKRYRYTLELITTSATATVSSSNYAIGKSWIMTAPHVPESGSRGNRSNRMAPGKMKNQIGFNRYTMNIEGNVANKVVPIRFEGGDTATGESMDLWINEEHKQFEMQMRTANNIDIYTSKYNRKTNGEIPLKYHENDKPIPMSAGVDEIVSETGNTDTYGYTLPLNKIKNIVGDVFWDSTDSGKMEVVIHCGQGFLEDFDTAVNNELTTTGVAMFTKLGDKKIGGDGMYLRYGGGYFNQYMTITGHLVTLKLDYIFDGGILGENDRANGNLHPRTGYPMSSHTGMFIDYSIYGGKRNVQVMSQKGRSNISGIVKGLTPVPAAWKPVGAAKDENGNILSNDKDAASYEVLQSRGINIANSNHCFKLYSSL